jgi:enoyl-CoA hydratase/carnithine racemase
MSNSKLEISFEQYSQKYPHIRMRRRDGILELRVHTDGASLKWGANVHEELVYCFSDVGFDRQNKVIIITGTGGSFCDQTDVSSFGDFGPQSWGPMSRESNKLLTSLLDIEVPIIGAVNGPAHIHAELAVLSDLVIASEGTTFQDGVHFTVGVVPGDGVHIVWPALLGPNRGRYFLLTGQKLGAQQALQLGVVSEVVAPDKLLSRAWELAEQVAAQPALARRYARVLLTQEYKRLMRDQLGYGLALEGAALADFVPKGVIET